MTLLLMSVAALNRRPDIYRLPPAVSRAASMVRLRDLRSRSILPPFIEERTEFTRSEQHSGEKKLPVSDCLRLSSPNSELAWSVGTPSWSPTFIVVDQPLLRYPTVHALLRTRPPESMQIRLKHLISAGIISKDSSVGSRSWTGPFSSIPGKLGVWNCSGSLL